MKNISIDEMRAGLEAGGAPQMWERVCRDLLPAMKQYAPINSRVLEVGYGDGLLSCYLAKELGWKIYGLDVSPGSHKKAIENVRSLGMEDSIDFHCCHPEETRKQTGRYDAVFIKTVLYNSPDLIEYSRWLDWILSILKPGGVLVNFESGRANSLVQLYRRLRGREYTNLCLYTPEVEALYNSRFEILERRYYGGLSQFFAPLFGLYRIVSKLEEQISERHAGNCFAVAMIGRKKAIDV